MADLALQAGGLRFALFDAPAGGFLTLEKLAHALLQFLFPIADPGGGDVFVDGDLLDGFFFLEGFKSNSGFEFGGQMSSFSFDARGRFSGLTPPHDQLVSSTVSWLRLAGPLRLAGLRCVDMRSKIIDSNFAMKRIHSELGVTIVCFHTSGGGLRVLMT